MGEDLLRDLTLYKAYKEKSVMMAARSLITLYREQLPALLHKKDRGRLTEAQAELKPKRFGEVVSFDNVPGAEVLLESAKSINVKEEDDSDSDDSWVDINESGDEINIKSDSDEENSDDEIDDGSDIENSDGSEDEPLSNEEEESENEDEDADEDVDEDEDEEDYSSDGESVEEQPTPSPPKSGKKNKQKEAPAKKVEKKAAKSNGVAKNKKNKAAKSTDVNESVVSEDSVTVLDKKEAAKEIALARIFTDEDFKRIDAQNIKKHVSNARKRPLEAEKTEYVKLNDIEMIYKKRRTDKASRLESVMKGREDREKFGYRDKRKNIHCSKTNSEKKKNKNFGMMRHKARSKVKKSFKDKQQSLRKHLLKQKKMK